MNQTRPQPSCFRRLLLALLLSGLVGAGAASAEQGSTANAVDGGNVVGYSYTPSGDIHAFFWTATTGMVDLGTLLASHRFSDAVAVSGGNVGGVSSSAPGSLDGHGFFWSAAGGMRDLGAGVVPIAVEGEMVYGNFTTASGNEHAFVWTPATGLQDLGTPEGLDCPDFLDNSHATAVSGGTVVGVACIFRAFDPQTLVGGVPFIWTAATGMREIPVTYPPVYTGAVDNFVPTGASGGDVVGSIGGYATPWCNSGNQNIPCRHAVLWNATDGLRDLGILGQTPNTTFWQVHGDSFATAVSGGNVVGYSDTSYGLGFHSFFWNAATGMQEIAPIGAVFGNSRAVAVSGANVTGENEGRAFFWTAANGLVDLGTLGGVSSYPSAISGGNVVGTADTADFEPGPYCLPPPYGCPPGPPVRHAFLWNAPAGPMVDLGSLALAFVTVTIDIKPDATVNGINRQSHGAVPVAILSTSDFDARTVDPSTVTLAGAPVKVKGNSALMASVEDVNGDGLPDLVVEVETRALSLTPTDVSATLLGRTFGGVYIKGVDSVRIVH